MKYGELDYPLYTVPYGIDWMAAVPRAFPIRNRLTYSLSIAKSFHTIMLLLRMRAAGVAMMLLGPARHTGSGRLRAKAMPAWDWVGWYS